MTEPKGALDPILGVRITSLTQEQLDAKYEEFRAALRTPMFELEPEPIEPAENESPV